MIRPSLFQICHVASTAPGQSRFVIQFDAAHRIYAVHFPGNPITPGACLVDMCLDLLSEATGTAWRMTCLKNVKFLAPVIPADTPQVTVDLTREPEKDTGAIACKAVISCQGKEYMRASMVCVPRPEATPAVCRRMLDRLGTMVVIPAYNHSGTVWQVVRGVMPYCSDVVVVDDGSTPALQMSVSAEEMEQTGCHVTLLSHRPNRGKGHALRQGFSYAASCGCSHALTIDADLQHRAADLPRFAAAAAARPDALLLGSRPVLQDGKPRRNSFANWFSNIWVKVETGRSLPDTQTGFRMYPIGRMRGMRLRGSRYEAEVAWIVRLIWKGIEVIPVPVDVDYAPPGGRITHFRGGADFLRISVQHALLCLAAVVYGWPRMLFRRYFRH